MRVFKSIWFSITNMFIAIKNNSTRFTGKVSSGLSSRPLLKKILYTLILLTIFRIAATITTPGIIVNQGFAQGENSFTSIMDMMGGGALRNFSIVALGISPYITASIIMTLLQSEVFPPIYKLSRSGPAGKRKINYITRGLTLFFAWLQAATIILQMRTGGISIQPDYNTTFWIWIGLPLILIAGSLFTLFLGEQITNNGIGNGTSLIIFSGIVVDLPSKFRLAYIDLANTEGETGLFVGMMNFLLYVIGFLALIYIIAYFYKAERHVPIQQTGSGMTHDVKQMSRLPIKLNPAGVMPVIFALTITILPLTVIQFLDEHNLFRQWMEANWSLTAPIGLSIFVLITFVFSIVMSIVTFNPTQIADNFKKNGTFIPGIKPGNQTEEYLTKIVIKLSLFSAFYLSAVSAIEYIQQMAGLSSVIAFGGTTIIILVSVAIETIDQLQARDQTQKISKAHKSAASSLNKDDEKKSSGGLLW